jgi:hypothetical protein
MAKFAMTWLLTVNGVTRKSQKTVTANDPGSQNYGPIEIANGATNQQLSIGGIDISQLVGVWIQSTEDVLIEFNDASGAGGSIALEAGIRRSSLRTPAALRPRCICPFSRTARREIWPIARANPNRAPRR